MPNPNGRASLLSELVGGGGGGAKGRSFTSRGEKVVDLLEGVLLFPEVFDQVLIMRVGTGVIDGLLRAQVLDDLSDTHEVFEGHV